MKSVYVNNTKSLQNCIYVMISCVMVAIQTDGTLSLLTPIRKQLITTTLRHTMTQARTLQLHAATTINC